MKIIIKTLKGEQIQVDIEPTSTVLQVKQQLQTLKNFDVDSQKLVYKGQILVNEKTVEQVGIKENEFIVLMVQVKKIAKPEQKMEQESQAKKEQPENVQQASQQPKSQSQPQQQQVVQQPVSHQSPEQQGTVQNQDLVMGEQYKKVVEEIMKMGFEKSKVEQALKAAFNNPDRAIEYLLTGIPQNNQLPAQNQPAQQGHQHGESYDDQDYDDQGDQDEPVQGNPQASQVFAQLASSPQFQQIRQVIQQNPQVLPQILQQIQISNPPLYQLISQNQQQFLQLIASGGPANQQGGQHLPPGTIMVTHEEKAAIDRIIALGFDKRDVMEAYFACDKDENMAVNYLIENQSKGTLFSTHQEQEELKVAQEQSLGQAQQGAQQQPGSQQPQSQSQSQQPQQQQGKKEEKPQEKPENKPEDKPKDDKKEDKKDDKKKDDDDIYS